MISESLLLFPKLITIGKHEVDELEKESWFSAYLEQSSEDGKSNENTGHQVFIMIKDFGKYFLMLLTQFVII